MNALGRSVTIVYECGCLSSTRINNVYFTDMPDTDESEGVTELPRVN